VTLVIGCAGAAREARGQAPSSQPPVRPRVGVALGGGSARGIAHVGVLRWLEEHRVPIDVLAGTSMGGLIGGAYATGMSPDEIGRSRGRASPDLAGLTSDLTTHLWQATFM